MECGKSVQAEDLEVEVRDRSKYTLSLSGDGDLNPAFIPSDQPREEETSPSGQPAPLKMADVEKEMLTDLMKKYQGNITRVARELGIARSTVYRKMRKYEKDPG